MSIDSEIMHRRCRENLDIIGGGIGPRMYDRQLLLKVYKNMQANLRDKLNAFEDSVIYYEISKLYKGKVQFIPDALPHRGRLAP